MEPSVIDSKVAELKQRPKVVRNFVKENKKLQRSIRNKQNSMTAVIQSQQKNNRIDRLHLISSTNSTKNQMEWNRFRKLYDNRHLPVRLDQRDNSGKSFRGIQWFEDLKLLSAERFMDLLVKFSYGLPLLQYPYGLIAELGAMDLLKNYVNSASVIQRLPQLVHALNAMLSSPKITKKKTALLLISEIAQIPLCGQVLISHYKQLLRPLLVLSVDKVYDIEYKCGKSLEECVEATLNTLEKAGYPKALPAIKRIIPTYESCMKF